VPFKKKCRSFTQISGFARPAEVPAADVNVEKASKKIIELVSSMWCKIFRGGQDNNNPPISNDSIVFE